MDWQELRFGWMAANRTLRSILIVLGLVLVSFGVLIVVLPRLLQFLVGGTFIVLGMALLGAAWRRRRPRRGPGEPGEEPDVIDEWR